MERKLLFLSKKTKHTKNLMILQKAPSGNICMHNENQWIDFKKCRKQLSMNLGLELPNPVFSRSLTLQKALSG